jgi:hypothetical protein
MPVQQMGWASTKQWWNALKTCDADLDSQPQNVKAPKPGGGSDTDTNPAADVRHYSDSREQGHQLSPQLNNPHSAEQAEAAGNQAGIQDAINNCVNRVLGGH